MFLGAISLVDSVWLSLELLHLHNAAAHRHELLVPAGRRRRHVTGPAYRKLTGVELGFAPSLA